jgi:hypothetical protein
MDGVRLDYVVPHEMFRRMTDDAIHARLGKRSLDVGADKIARTADAALKMLDESRSIMREQIPLAWSPQWTNRIAAIEVYPAATRKTHDAPEGAEWLHRLPSHAALELPSVPTSSDAQDAILCVVAAFDFLMGRSVSPLESETERAKREGWIWAARTTR